MLRVRAQPFLNALQMEGVATGTPHDGAVVAWIPPLWWAPVEVVTTDAADVVPGVPRPVRYGVPVLDGHLESHVARALQRLVRYHGAVYDALNVLLCYRHQPAALLWSWMWSGKEYLTDSVK